MGRGRGTKREGKGSNWKGMERKERGEEGRKGNVFF